MRPPETSHYNGQDDNTLKNLLKKWLSRALGKSGPPVVAVFLSGDEALSRSMALQMRELAPGHPHVIIGPAPVDRAAYPYADEIIEADPRRFLSCWVQLRRRLGRRWIALAPFVWFPAGPLRWLPWLLAPRKLLAFNSQLERHHLRLRCPLPSWRFLRGQPVGDIFRPTVFAGLKRLAALAGFPLLLGCWVAVQVRRRRAVSLGGPQPAQRGIAVVTSVEPGAGLDQAVAAAPFDRVLVTREEIPDDLSAKLAESLEEPGVWLACCSAQKTSLANGIPAAGEAKIHEGGTWALCSPSSACMFRRDVYLELGGTARLERSYPGRGMLALSLLGWQRGRRTVFAGPAEAGATDCAAANAAPERLILGAVTDFFTVLRILWGWSWQWQRWKGALGALDVTPTPPPPGRADRTFLSLLDPGVHVFRGRPRSHSRRVAVISPYLPFPLSHGGAIRIFNLLRAASAGADVYLFAFAEKETGREVEPLLAFCTRVVLVQTPRWEPPALLRLLPRGVAKFQSPAMRAVAATVMADEQIPIAQVEYTQLAHLGTAFRLPVKKVLVEHDVTFDLHRQLRSRARGWQKVAAWREEARWRRYELGRARAFDRVITMSQDDRERLVRAGLPAERVSVVENGVDLDRFQPAAPAASSSPELLFIGSFRHFPNILGFRFFLETVWPALRAARPDLRMTAVAGGDHRYYWRLHTGGELPAMLAEIKLLDFVEDVRPLYRRATVVVVPLVVSAGTNIKVLEALAMRRALVSTTVGVAGLGLTSGENVLLADAAEGFASAILDLLSDDQKREQMADCGRAFVEARYGWESLGKKLLAVWDELATGPQ